MLKLKKAQRTFFLFRAAHLCHALCLLALLCAPALAQTKALGLFGADDYADVSTSASTGAVTRASVCAWFKTAATGGYIVGNADSNELRVTSSGGVDADFFNGSQSVVVASPASYNDSAWHLACGVRSDATLTLYVDGAGVNSGSFANGAAAYTYRLSAVGRRGATSAQGYYKGLVRGVRLYSKALSGAEVTALYNSGAFAAGAPAAALVAGYDLTDGTGTSLADFSGNAHTGTLTEATAKYSHWFDATRSGGARTWYATTSGSVANTGVDAAHGWDLQTALSHGPEEEPGDTVIISDGTYNGLYFSYLRGTAAARFTVRQATLGTYPPAAILDGANRASGTGTGTAVLTIAGPYTDLREVDVRNSNPARTSSTGLSAPTDIAVTEGVKVTGAEVRVINCVTHDNSSNGLSAFDVQNPQIYGLITYNNGWHGTDRDHAHGVYTHNGNAAWTTTVGEIASLFPYYYNLQYYNSQYESPSYGLNITGGVGVGGVGFGIVGSGPKHGFTVSKLRLWNSALQLGYSDEDNYDVTSQDNDIYGSLDVLAWRTVDIQRNRVVQPSTVTGGIAKVSEYASGLIAGGTRDNNQYWRGKTGGGNNFYRLTLAGAIVTSGNFSLWKTNTGYDADSTYNDNANQSAVTEPTGAWVDVRPNAESAGRALVSVFNWDDASTVSVNLSASGLVNGQAYRLYDLQNPLGSAIATGTYSSAGPSISLTMPDTTAAVAQPVNDGSKNAHTPKKFGAFLLIPGAVDNSAPADPSNLSCSRASSTSITCAGTDNASNETGFVREISADGGATWGTAGSNLAAVSGTGGAVSFTLTGLTPRTSAYRVRVRATNAAGDSLNATSAAVATTVLCAWGLPCQ